MNNEEMWPYGAAISIFTATIFVLMAVTDSVLVLIGVGLPLLYLLVAAALFICIVQSKELKEIPFQKKVGMSLVPFMWFNTHFQYWVVKDLDNVTYEEFLENLHTKR